MIIKTVATIMHLLELVNRLNITCLLKILKSGILKFRVNIIPINLLGVGFDNSRGYFNFFLLPEHLTAGDAGYV